MASSLQKVEEIIYGDSDNYFNWYESLFQNTFRYICLLRQLPAHYEYAAKNVYRRTISDTNPKAQSDNSILNCFRS